MTTMIDTLLASVERQLRTSDYRGLAPGESAILRITIPIADCDPLSWLRAQQGDYGMYWRDRRGAWEAAGLGHADLVLDKNDRNFSASASYIEKMLQGDCGNARYFGGMRFNPQTRESRLWLPFGISYFALPEFEVLRQESGCEFAWQAIVNRDTDMAELEAQGFAAAGRLKPPPSDVDEIIPDIRSRRDLPGEDGWGRNIATVLELIEAEKAEKIVLARRSTLQFAGAAPALQALDRLRAINPDTFHFYFRPQAGLAFFGATPERLYRRSGDKLESEAVAGTRQRGATKEEDVALGRELLGSDKDVREHDYVWRRISAQLGRLGVRVDANRETRLLRLARVQHLYSFVNGSLSGAVSNAELLAALHPTPAVGGSPTDIALAAIDELEPFDRGWYAGPVGWIGKQSAEFAVAIRSGLAIDSALHLYTGAGILRGSQAESEWNEIENKMAAFMNALAV